MGAGGSVQSSNEDIARRTFPTFEVGLLSVENYKFNHPIPARFLLRLCRESLDFVDNKTLAPILQFPFQQIICWGSTVSTFRFHVYNYENVSDGPNDAKDICFILKTTEGKNIEDMTMKTVKLLMVDMDNSAVSKEEFQLIINHIYDSSTNSLSSDWFQTLDQFSTGRKLLAKQCMDLIQLVGPLAPFEKMDLACLLHTRILTPGSFQLIVNTFDDKAERQNLIHRLGLNRSEAELTADCSILPSQISVPLNPSPSKIHSTITISAENSSGPVDSTAEPDFNKSLDSLDINS